MQRIATAFLVVAALVPPSLAQSKTSDTSKYRVLGWDKNHIAIVNGKGEVEWEYPVQASSMHDIQLLPNGNILFHNGATVREVTRDKQVVWEYASKPKDGYSGRVTVHAFERLPNGLTMIAESGNQRLIEVDKDGKIVHEIPLTVDKPSPGSDTRLVRSVPGGGYLVAHEADGKVREYDRNGKVVWEYAMDMNNLPASPGLTGHGVNVFSAKRLPNGNTLIGGGNNNRVIEVDKSGKIVWSVEAKDLQGITLAWITTIDPLPNGDVIFGNSHAGPDNPQLIEVTRDKKVVWTFKNWDEFGNTLVATKVIRDGK
jgi:hypothetical protein